MVLELPQGLTLYFSRHGQTQANVEKRFSGYKDTPITELGLTQAPQVGHILKRELGAADGFHFVSSPLARAIATMEKRKKDTSSSKITDAAKRPMMYRITACPLPIAEPWWWGLH